MWWWWDLICTRPRRLIVFFFSASSLNQQSADRHVAPRSTLSWFQANQSLLFLLNAACLAEKQHISILVFGLTRLGLEPTIYQIQGELANHYTNNAVHRILISLDTTERKQNIASNKIDHHDITEILFVESGIKHHSPS
jgi:hypothetical protein